MNLLRAHPATAGRVRPSSRARARAQSRHARSFGGGPRRQHGFGALVAIVVLVVLAALAAAIVRFGGVAQVTTTHSLLAARAAQAAAAGTDWGLYQALKGTWVGCTNVSQSLDLSASTGLYVTVTCTSRGYNEGETSPGTPRFVRMYTIDAVACSSPSCPDNSAATTPHYVERRRQVQASN